jgi:hypothetical protein
MVGATAEDGRAGSRPLTKRDYEALARFRFGIRRYLRFSEETVRSHGVTPQQYQLLLALKGFPGRETRSPGWGGDCRAPAARPAS